MKHLAIIVEQPIAPNFSKQIKLLAELFPEIKFDIVGTDGYWKLEAFDFSKLNRASRPKRGITKAITLFNHLFSYFRKNRPDLVMNISDTTTVAPVAVLLCRLFRVPVVIRIAGMNFDVYKVTEWYQRFTLFVVYNIIGNIIFRLANALIVMGPLEKERLVRRGFDGDKIHPIPPIVGQIAIDKALTSDRKELREKLGFPSEKKIVLFVGRPKRIKGIHILTRIAKEIYKQRDDILFCIVGSGICPGELEELQNVKIVGFVEPADVGYYYCAADLLIVPSLAEGIPNVIIEAISHNLPVVASNVGEIPWIVSNTFDPNDWSGFASYILKGKWELDAVPEVFSGPYQRNQFKELFEYLI